jgi:hypothetical protein
MKTTLFFLLICSCLSAQESKKIDSLVQFTARTTMDCDYDFKTKSWGEWQKPFPIKKQVKTYLKDSTLFLDCYGTYKLVTAIGYDEGIDQEHKDKYVVSKYEAKDGIGNKHIRIEIYSYESGEYAISICQLERKQSVYFSKK